MAEPLHADPFHRSPEMPPETLADVPPDTRSDPRAGAPQGSDQEPVADETTRRNALESVVHHLLDAGPEVAEHVVGAAQELLLAAQAIVTAAERAVAEQRAQRDAGGASADGTLYSVSDPE